MDNEETGKIDKPITVGGKEITGKVRVKGGIKAIPRVMGKIRGGESLEPNELSR
ncbi:MAG: hypothetical protein ABL867_09075 [Rickettsiales bacterium]